MHMIRVDLMRSPTYYLCVFNGEINNYNNLTSIKIVDHLKC